MKKRAIILVSVLLLIGSIVYSADESIIRSKIGEGVVVENGRAWLVLDLLSKYSYVKGLSLGITWGGGTVLRQFSLLSDKEKEKAAKALDEITPKATWNEIVEYIDEIYKNPLNRALTIADAYTCMAFEQNGKLNKNNRDEFLQKIIAAYK
jgi:hypothetical protein